MEEAFPEAYLRRIGSQSREAWWERTRTVKERLAAEVPAAAPITEPAPKTPDGTCRTMVTGRTLEEEERRRPVEEPVAAPVTNPAWSEEWLRIRRTEKKIPVAEVPAAAPVTVPAPKTPDGTCRTMVTSRTRRRRSGGVLWRRDQWLRSQLLPLLQTLLLYLREVEPWRRPFRKPI